MGVHLSRISRIVRRVTGCERVYVLSFAEVRRQVHLHLVPRHCEDPATAGWAVADHYRAVQQGRTSGAQPAESERAFAGIAKALERAD